MQAKYRVSEQNITWIKDCDFEAMFDHFQGLEEQLSKEEGVKTLVIYAIAAHGSLLNGSQCILIDEFDSNVNFYARFPAE